VWLRDGGLRSTNGADSSRSVGDSVEKREQEMFERKVFLYRGFWKSARRGRHVIWGELMKCKARVATYDFQAAGSPEGANEGANLL
jgi:hypothetical protein